MLPLVSICTPVYNSSKFIAQTIESVLKQTYENWELILVDDGSTDDSAAIIRKFDDPRICVFNQDNHGAASARNIALSHAYGEFIQFLDADDIIPPEKIETQINTLLENKDCIVGCNWVRFSGSTDRTFGAVGPHASIRKTCSPLEWLLARHTMLIHCWLTPMELIKRAGLWDERLSYNDDGEFFARVIAQADQVLYADQTIAYYRTENHESISSDLGSTEKNYSLYLAAVSYKNVLENLAPGSKEIRKASGNYFRELTYLFYPAYPQLIKKCESHPELKLSDLKYKGGSKITDLISSVLGWKLTKRLILMKGFIVHSVKNPSL